MLRRISLSIVTLLATSFSVRADDVRTPRVEDILPRDTQAVLIVRDLPALVKKLESHPWAKSLADEQVRRFFAPVLRVLEDDYTIPAWEKEMEMTWREALGKFPGQVAFAWDFQALIPPNPKQETRSAASTTFIADIGDNADTIRKMIGAPTAPPAPEANYKSGTTTEQFEGVTLTLSYLENEGQRTDAGGWAIVGRQLVSASPTPVLKRTVHEMLNPSLPGTHLAAAPAYQRFRRQQADVDAVVLVNAPAALKVLTDILAADQMPIQPLNPWEFFALTPTGISHVLGIDSIETFYLSLTIREPSTDLELGMLHQPSRDLLRTLAFEQGRPHADLVPDNALSTFTAQFNVSESWSAIREVAQNFRLTSDTWKQWLAELKQQSGVDIEHDILANVGSQISVASFVAGAAKVSVAELVPLDRLIVIELKDAKRFEAAIGKLIEWSNKATEQVTIGRYANRTIYNVDAAFSLLEEGIKLRMVVIERALVVCVDSGDFLEHLLTRIAQKKVQPFWNQPNLHLLLDRAPVEIVGIGYCDGPTAFWNSWLAACKFFHDLDDLIDVQAPPDMEVIRKYFASVVTILSSSERSKILRIEIRHQE